MGRFTLPGFWVVVTDGKLVTPYVFIRWATYTFYPALLGKIQRTSVLRGSRKASD